MRSTDVEPLSRRLGDRLKRNSLSFSVRVAAKRLTDITNERDDLLLWLNNYRVSKNDLERKVLKQDVAVEVLKASMKQLEKTGARYRTRLDFHRRPIKT